MFETRIILMFCLGSLENLFYVNIKIFPLLHFGENYVLLNLYHIFVYFTVNLPAFIVKPSLVRVTVCMQIILHHSICAIETIIFYLDDKRLTSFHLDMLNFINCKCKIESKNQCHTTLYT